MPPKTYSASLPVGERNPAILGPLRGGFSMSGNVGPSFLLVVVVCWDVIRGDAVDDNPDSSSSDDAAASP